MKFSLLFSYGIGIITISVSGVNCTFSNGFRDFLRRYYDDSVEQFLSRVDVGGGGSFGGGEHEPETQTRRRPVIIVHGITNTAGTFGRIQKYFLNHGYADEEVFGTTYGDGGKTNMLFVTMNCHYVKIVRMLIQAVAEYTSSKVNVIAYSMGSPVARKAILGGKCVDTGEQLGAPIGGIVYTFVGVAGANFGSFLCVIPFGSCNLQNGMGCDSTFLNDINSRYHYEGDMVYTIFSTGDDKVGYRACGRLASSIPKEDAFFVKNGMNHDSVMYNTVNLQYNLVTYHRATPTRHSIKH